MKTNCAHLSAPNSNCMQKPIGGRLKCLPAEKRVGGGGSEKVGCLPNRTNWCMECNSKLFIFSILKTDTQNFFWCSSLIERLNTSQSAAYATPSHVVFVTTTKQTKLKHQQSNNRMVKNNAKQP